MKERVPENIYQKLPFFSTCLCDPSIFSLSSISKFEMIGEDMENIVLDLFSFLRF